METLSRIIEMLVLLICFIPSLANRNKAIDFRFLYLTSENTKASLYK